MEPEDHDPDYDPDHEPLTSYHVQRAKKGDAESLDWLIARLSPLLLAQAQYRLKPLSTAFDPEDLVQDAWVAALPKLATLGVRDGRHTPVLLKYLGASIVNIVNNLIRRRIRDGRHRDEMVHQDPAEVHALQSGVVSRAVQRELGSIVREQLDRLDEKDREIVILRGIEQMQNTAIAEMTGMGVEAVTKRYQRALGKLRNLMPGSVVEELLDE